jgi:hypothetical protein
MRRVSIVLLSVVLLSFALTTTASAATEAQKLSAILNGLAHLDAVQCKTAGSNFGSWGTSQCGAGYGDAYTGAAVFAFLTTQAKWPAGALAATYASDVTNGVNYLLSVASTQSISTNDNLVNICPGGTGSCTAIYWNVCGDQTYCTGFVASAIDTYALTKGVGNVATAAGPLAGLTWTQIAQGITNAYAAGQATTKDGNNNGGWRYTIPSNDGSDMSTAQWGAIASGYDESVGAVTPANVKPGLQKWLAYDILSGAACYEGGATAGTCGIGPDNAENGAWLVSNSWAGGGTTTNAIAFLNTNWKTSINATWYGNFGNPYAMWSSYKGLEAAIGLSDTTHIGNLMTACGIPTNSPGSGICNWWEDYNEWLVNVTARSTDGSGNLYWPGAGEWFDPLSTSVFTAIIGAAALPNSITQGGTPASVPAVSQWGLVALGVLLVTFAAMKLRGRRTA